jgi:hypothetical protein
VFYSQISGHLIAAFCVIFASKYKEESLKQQHLPVGYTEHPCTSLVVFGSLAVRTGSHKLYHHHHHHHQQQQQ